MTGRIALGPLIAAAGALLLAVSLFLHWYDDASGFTVFEVLDLVLFGLAAATLASLAGTVGLGPLVDQRHALPLAVAALVIVLSQAVNEPPAIVHTEEGPEIGLWLGLAGAGLMVMGALLAVTRISLAVDVERRRQAAVAVETEPRPASVDPDAPTETRPPGAEPH
jgi:hypothetical protein